MKSASLTILASLKETHPDVTVFRRKVVDSVATTHGFIYKDYSDLFDDAYRVHKGTYDYTSLLRTTTVAATTVSQVAPMTPAPAVMKLATSVNSIVNTDAYIPQSDPTYIRWGEFSDISIKLV
jgi:hypothetical protein